MEIYDRPPSQVLFPALRPEQEQRPSGDTETPEGERPITYYDHPMIKRPAWRWYIPLYFWMGGIAGGAAVVSAAAHFLGGRGARETVRFARYLTPFAAGLSALLLIADLHRPERFYRMFRVFKVTSPLSVGTWILSAFSIVSGALAARQAAEDNFIVKRESRLGRFIRAVTPAGPLTAAHGLLGFGLGGYTGVLLAATAIPLWAAGGVLLGPLFLATALASGAGTLNLLSVIFGKGDAESESVREAVETAQIASAVAQLGLTVARDTLSTKRITEPLNTGVWGLVYRAGGVGAGMASPIALTVTGRLLGPRAARVLGGVGAGLSIAGALAERLAIVEAGKKSAADPLAYQEFSAGRPGEARPTPRQQAVSAPRPEAFVPRVAASDTYNAPAQ